MIIRMSSVMKSTSRILNPVLLAMVLILSSFLIQPPSSLEPVQTVSANNDPPPQGGHVEGDWTVTDSRSYTSCTITLHGNLIIQGSLTFNDVTLLIQSDEANTFMIDVSGSFTVTDLDGDPGTSHDASVISPEDLGYHFDMNIAIQASVDLRNSMMRSYNDITVLSSNVNFIDNAFTDLSGSGIDVYGAAPTFRGNNVSYDQMSGNAFVFNGCNGLVFEDNRIDHPWFHVIADGCEGITFRNNQFMRGDRGIVVHGTTATIEDNYFWWNGKTVVVEEGTAIVRRNTFYQNAAAMATDEFTTNDLEAYDNHIEECSNAFLLPGPGSESTARIHDNTILNCGAAVGLFTGFSARIFNNHIEGCGLALYTDTSVSEFYENTIINNSYVIYSRHGGVTEASNNLIANNVLVGYLTEGSMLTLENNAIRFNIMGIHTYERNSGGTRAVITGNDFYDNPLFAIWNVDDNAHIEAVENYWGGVPNQDGDLLIGPDIYYEPYSTNPFNPLTPPNPFTPHIISGSESYQGKLETTGPWIVRHGGNLSLDGIDLDLGGYFLGVKYGGALTADGSIANGSALAIASDQVRLLDLNISGMQANILDFFGGPYLRNVHLSTPVEGFPWYLMPRTLMWSAHSNPTIDDCRFDTDDQTYDIIFDRSTGTVRRCLFESGRGIEASSGVLRIENCVFQEESTGIRTTETHLTLTENDLDAIALDGFGSDTTFNDNRISNSNIDLQSMNITLQGNSVSDSSMGFRDSDLDIDANVFYSTTLQLSHSQGSMRNNTVESGSRLVLDDFRGVIANNTFKDGNPAIAVTRGTAHINYNNFLNNEVAISNTGSNRVNAIYNYWSAEDGPGGEGTGSGDPIHGDVMYEPWAYTNVAREGALLNFAPIVNLDEYDLIPDTSLLLSGWAWDPDGDSFTVEVSISGSNYDTGWVLPVQFEQYPGWTRWYYLWDPNGEDYGSFHPEVRVSDGLTTTYVENPGTFLYSPPDYSDHAPIRINSDAEFLIPSNGVTGGSGTMNDPYRINGWRIIPLGGGDLLVPAIEIRNVQSHVVIENCYFTGGLEDSWYVSIVDSPHVNTIHNNVFNVSQGGGLHALNEVGVPITMNITDNLFAGIESFGVQLKNYSMEAVGNHVVGDGWTGGPMYVHTITDNEDALMRDNVFYNADDGFVFQGLDGEVSGNLFIGCTAGGMIQSLFSDLYIHDNLFARSAFGSIFNGGVPHFENNTFIENQQISLYNGQNQGLTAIFRNNIFKNNRDGIANTFGGYSDARYNYWGAPDGPSGEGSGSGDPVDDLTQFDPWHTDGPLAPDHPPRIMFIEPGNYRVVKDEIELIWYTLDLDEDDLTVKLEFSPWDDPSDLTTIAVLHNAYRHIWNVTEVMTGSFRIQANVTSNNVSHQAISGKIYVDHNTPPLITIIEPDGLNDVCDTTFTIEWQASDEDDDHITIDLFYDDDEDPENGMILIEDSLKNIGNYAWDCSELEDGDYYVVGVADDGRMGVDTDYSNHPVSIDHWDPGENHNPVIHILQPDGDNEADETFTITWTATDEDEDTLMITLYNDDDTDPENGKTVIESDLENTGSYIWDCSDVGEGKYHVYGVVDDNNGSQAGDYSSGTITIAHSIVPPPENHPPEINVSVTKDDDHLYLIEWDATDEDDDLLSIDLYYDVDTDPGNGKILIAEDLMDTASYYWDSSDLEEGDYFILGVAMDGNGGETLDYSSRTTITNPKPLPDFSITSLDVLPLVPVEGAAVTFRAIVENLGNAEGMGRVEFYVDGIEQDNRSLTLKPGKKETVIFIWTAIEGDHTIMVRVNVQDDIDPDNDQLEETMAVTDSPIEVKGEDDEFPAVWAGILVIAIILVIGTITIYRRNRWGGFDTITMEGGTCPECMSLTTYYADEDDYYCWECKEYVGGDGSK